MTTDPLLETSCTHYCCRLHQSHSLKDILAVDLSAPMLEEVRKRYAQSLSNLGNETGRVLSALLLHALGQLHACTHTASAGPLVLVTKNGL